MGATVTAVSAWDADERGGDGWQVDYRLESGNEEDAFSLLTDTQTNEVSLILSKVSPLCSLPLPCNPLSSSPLLSGLYYTVLVRTHME